MFPEKEFRKQCEKYLKGMDTPVVVRWCDEHQRYEWWDSFSKYGNVAKRLSTVKRQMREHYRCPCGLFHVFYVIFNGEEYRFYDFIYSP